ncbi:uncharacterized protein LOC123012628 [Tribolium madens]|uniref:uncharacterized protein LOC123012628 n=1 Tax=Tribolium madens TaxID=41895 RepID=UPI001CF73F68|nr:uncharacterized protein LOC123012628 [Tribolium madens]
MGTIVYGTGHIKTSQGIIKIAEAVVCFIGLILIAIDGWSRDLTNAYVVGTAVGLVISFLLLILHITKAGRPLQGFLAFQIYYNVVLFIYLLVVSAIILSENYNNRYMAGGSFGTIACVLYLVDAIDCYRTDPSPLFCFA